MKCHFSSTIKSVTQAINGLNMRHRKELTKMMEKAKEAIKTDFWEVSQENVEIGKEAEELDDI